jgi:mannose-6-phosphate isomerase-like protein (cupin superfamily)
MPNATHPAVSRAEDTAVSWFFDRVRSTALDRTRPSRPVLAERRARSGFMTPLHRRSEEEVHVVVEGEVSYFVDEETVRAASGEVVILPPDAQRTLRVESEQAAWLVLTRVSSLGRFEDFGRALSRPAGPTLAAGWPGSQEAGALAAIAWENGIEVIGPPGSLPALA